LAAVYHVELVQTLCKLIAAEKDPEIALALIALLRAVISENQEEIRLRMNFLRKKYSLAFRDVDEHVDTAKPKK